MAIKSLTACAALLLLLLAGRADSSADFTLVSDDEVDAEQRFEAQPKDLPGEVTRSLDPPSSHPSQPPSIIVISPQPGNPTLTSPLRLEFGFATARDAKILPDSFRIRYGLLQIDLTDRLRPYATITPTGLVAAGAALPPGNHRLFLEIRDSAGRSAVCQLQFTVNGSAESRR